jgi:Uma2 family endonuclease
MPSALPKTSGSFDGAPWSDVDGLLVIPSKAHTLPGFRAWALSNDFPEKLRATYVQGQVYLDMSKEEIQTHSLVKTEVGGVLWNLNIEVDFGELFINGVLVTNVEADLSNNPDMVAVLWDSVDAGLVRFVSKKGRELEIVGSPDWAMEIVSDSSVVKDKETLRRAYHLAKLREYWLIDARGSEIDFQMLVWRRNGYVAVQAKDGWLSSRVFGRSFRLTRQRNRRGAWKYKLAVKAE